MRLRKIISGGQTGADRGGLEAARILGLQTGGTAPQGYFTEYGPDLSLKEFGLVEGDRGYKSRTAQNVKDSDGTVIFGIPSPGSDLTERECRAQNKPFTRNPSISDLLVFFKENSIAVLNVAGNRESVSPGICDSVIRYLLRSIAYIRRVQ